MKHLDCFQIPGRGKIKRTAKIHLEGGFGSKVGEKIRKKAATFRREKKLVNEKRDGISISEDSGDSPKVVPERSANAKVDDSKAKRLSKRQKLNSGDKAAKEEKEAETHLEIAAGGKQYYLYVSWEGITID